MPASIKLGHVWGIPIGLHFSWRYLISSQVFLLMEVES